MNKLNREQWERAVYAQVPLVYLAFNRRLQTKRFQKKCLWAIRRGYDGKDYGVQAQWNFAGAFLYSLTVVTTIGYGNTAAKTYFGGLILGE